MNDFQMVHGFEEVWRPAVGGRRTSPLALLDNAWRWETRARLSRVASRAPEVLIKVSGRTLEIGALRAHLNYVSRNGLLPLEDRDGAILESRSEFYDTAESWEVAAATDSRRRINTPLTHSLILSMPAGTDPARLRDAARAFAEQVFGRQHDFLFALHTDTPRPHVHLAVRSRGDMGQRLNPRKADLEAWRQVFAQMLRDRGVEAEATPRRARGVTRKPERTVLRRIRERVGADGGVKAHVVQSAYRAAARAAFQGDTAAKPWEHKLVERQAKIRSLYLAQAKLLQRSLDPIDRALGAKVEAFVKSMPAPDTQRLALARELRAANQRLQPEQPESHHGRER